MDGTRYVYDGLNVVQEIPNSGTTTNMLTGLGLDEYLTRSDANGLQAIMTDALGSTVGLVNSAGSLATQYSYQPFGIAAATGTSSPNPYQFSGREFDGAGQYGGNLYYLRERYYNPVLQRFISPDPLGFAGGDTNLYAYAGNDPADFVDPLGLKSGSPGGSEAAPKPKPPAPGWPGPNPGPTMLNVAQVSGGSVGTVAPGLLVGGLAAEGGGIGMVGAADVLCGPGCWIATVGALVGGYVVYHSLTGKPNSTVSDRKQTRRYGPDGFPEVDVDKGHAHMPYPHAHDWGRPSDGSNPTKANRGFPRPLRPGDPPVPED